MAKDPAFLFYPADFTLGTMGMSYEQIGKYITLLILQHSKGGYIKSRDVKRILNLTNDEDIEILEKFKINENGDYYNKRLLDEMVKREEHSQKQRENANKRWNKDTVVMPSHYNGNANAMPLGNENKDLYVNTNTNNNISLKESKPILNTNNTISNNTKKNNSIKVNKTFVPPTLEEIEKYCRERKNNVDPNQFYDYFTTGEWFDSKGQKVKNWKQKIITWEKHNIGTARNNIKNGKPDVKPDWLEDYVKEQERKN